MRGFAFSLAKIGAACGAALVLFLRVSIAHAEDRKPVWTVDLHRLQSERSRDQITIKYSGSYLVVYAGSWYASGKSVIRVREPRLVFDSAKGEVVGREHWSDLALPPGDECLGASSDKRDHGVVIIDCRNQMVIEWTGGGGTKFDPSEYYLREPGKDKVLIFRARSRCQPGAPKFISDEYILLRPCNNNLVVNTKGEKIYDMPNLGSYYVTLNREGTRFAVYERGVSFFNQLEGTADRLRVRVFRSSDGRMLFDYGWHTGGADDTYDGRIALSDDGSLLAILRGEEALVFKLPSGK